MKTQIKLLFAIPIVGIATLLIFALDVTCNFLEFSYNRLRELCDAIENSGHAIADSFVEPRLKKDQKDI